MDSQERIKRQRKYLERRATAIEAEAHKRELDMARNMQDALTEAYGRIEKEIYALYGKYAENQNLSLADAKKYLNDSERAEFQKTVEDYVAMARNNKDGRFDKQLDALSARARISRLEALQTRSAMFIRDAYNNLDSTMRDKLEDLIKNTSMRTAYDIQRATGRYEPFEQLDQARLQRILTRPWSTDGKTFSKRLWSNQDTLVKAVQREMVSGMIGGVDPDRMTKNIQSEFGAAKYAAKRLALTEGAYFASSASEDTYKDYDVDKVQILVTLDDVTCDECGPEDGKIIDMKDYSPGITVPPFHPNCRCTTVPYFPDNVLAGQEKRTARDQKTGKTELVKGDLTYEQWQEQYVNAMAMGDEKPDPKWPLFNEDNVISKATYKEIRSYANKRHIALSGFRKFDGDIGLIKNCIDELAECVKQYPEVYDENHLVTLELVTWLKPKDYASTAGRVIRINADAFRDKAMLEQQYKDDVDRKWFASGTDFHSIMYHEFGHVLANTYDFDPIAIALSITGLGKEDIFTYIINNLSEYAGSFFDGGEILSEVMSDLHSPNPSDFSLKFYKEWDKIKMKKASKGGVPNGKNVK